MRGHKEVAAAFNKKQVNDCFVGLSDASESRNKGKERLPGRLRKI